jgi:hypothetical protein
MTPILLLSADDYLIDPLYPDEAQTLKDPSDRRSKICPKTGENGPERVSFRVDKH